jgi:hypothetical protein
MPIIISSLGEVKHDDSRGWRLAPALVLLILADEYPDEHRAFQ